MTGPSRFAISWHLGGLQTTRNCYLFHKVPAVKDFLNGSPARQWRIGKPACKKSRLSGLTALAAIMIIAKLSVSARLACWELDGRSVSLKYTSMPWSSMRCIIDVFTSLY
jgi:hypothetical protein